LKNKTFSEIKPVPFSTELEMIFFLKISLKKIKNFKEV